ncbi:MAG: hypothetical protein ACK47O_12530, partial [Betaproteobacteria bacterium]
ERASQEARIVQGSADGSLSGAEMAQLGRTIHALDQETGELELRWLEVGEQLQGLETPDKA